MIIHSDKEKFQHLNSITHDGKVLLVATATDGTLWYSVKQDGFEDSYLQTDPKHRTGWEKWKELPLPGRRQDEHSRWKEEEADQSVIDREKEEFAVPKGSNKLEDLIIQSRYNTYDQSAVAPVQLVSGLGHLYIFRQSKAQTLLVDRFVLDGMTNELVRKLEVRFKRSGQKYKPLQSTKDGKPGKLTSIDSLDFRDANNQSFYEPTTELSRVKNLFNGWFSVVLVPTTDHDIHRWHVFSYELEEKRLVITSIRSSKEGLFDVKDHFVVHPHPTRISGIVRRTIALTDSEENKLTVINSIVATKYDIQTERETKDGPQLMRGATRIMLAIPTDDGNTAALSFAVATDGTLSRIDESPEGKDEPLRATEHEIMLPLNTLDKIKTIGDSTPPPHGQIAALRRNGEDDRVVVSSLASNVEKLEVGDIVKIEGTDSYDGHYDKVREPVEANAFSIDVKSGAQESMGAWTKVDKEEAGLVFDGIITGVERNNDELRVASPGHGLSKDDEVQIEATQNCNGVYKVASREGTEFTIERKWQPGTSVNVKREASKRRGIQFNNAQAYLETPVLALDDPAAGKPCGTTVSSWVFVPEGGAMDRILVEQKDESVRVLLRSGHVVLEGNFASGIETLQDPNAIPIGEWVHYAAVVSSSQKKGTESLETIIELCRNGVEVSSSGPHAEAVVTESTDSIQVQAKNKEIQSEQAALIIVDERCKFYEAENARAALVANFAWTHSRDMGLWTDYDHTTWELKIGTYTPPNRRDWYPEGQSVPEGLCHTYVDGCSSFDVKTIDGNTDPVVITTELKRYTDARNSSEIRLTTLKKQLADIEQDRKERGEIIEREQKALKALANRFRIGGNPAAKTTSAGPIKIADVQIWNKTRSAKEIKDSMYLTLTGQETDLAGYWRMGGIVPGESRAVVDFSVHRCNATVHGDAFVAAKTLESHLQAKDENGKAIPATKFINEELFAVSQRARYVETFEFRIDGGTEPAVDLFKFAYWGKKSRGAEGQIPEKPVDANALFAVTQSSFKPAAGVGWYVASCSFIVPDGVTLVRSFGISNVTGDWNELHVRKHRMVNVSDCITEERLSDQIYVLEPSSTSNLSRISMPKLANDQAAFFAQKELENLEKKQGKLIREKLHLEMLLYNNESWEKLVSAKQEKIKVANDTFKQANDMSEGYEEEQKRSLLIANFNWTHSRDMGLWTDYDHTTWPLKIGKHSPPNRRDWYPDGQSYPNGIISDYIDGCASFDITTLERTTALGKNIGGNIDAEFIKTKLKYYSEASMNAQVKLLGLEKHLAELQRKRAQERPMHVQRLKIVKKEVEKLTTTMSTASDKVLKGVENARQKISVMVSLHTDDRKLETLGAMLGFVRPTSRINAYETCEGNVQMDYFDDTGQMHHVIYDATSDSRNGNFETWIPNGVRSCLDFNESAESMKLPKLKPIKLPDAWTIEAWVSFPLKEADYDCTSLPFIITPDGQKLYSKFDWRCLAGTQDGDDAYIVAQYHVGTDTEMLGMVMDRSFYSSGYELTHLSAGWHHIAAVAKGGKTVYYIDGRDVSTLKLNEAKEEVNNLRESCSKEALQIDDARQKVKELERTLSEKAKTNEKLMTIIADSKQEREYLVLKALPNERAVANEIEKARGLVELLDKSAQPQQPITVIGSAPLEIRTVQESMFVFWSRSFRRVAELRIWGVALTKEEIEVNSKTLLSGNEPGLLAYYPMDEAAGNKIRDKTGRGHNGTIQGPKWWGCSAPIGLITQERPKVIQFDGVKDCVRVANKESFEFGVSTDFTIELWVKTAMTDQDDPCLVSNKDWTKGSYKGFVLFIKNGICRFNLGDGNDIPNNKNRKDLIIGKINDEKWHHIAVTVSRRGNIIGYQNGVETKRQSASGLDNIDTDYPFNAGQDGTGNYPCWFKGELTGIRLSKGARTPQNIKIRSTTNIPDASILIPDSIISCEYSTINVDDKTGRKASMMRRCLIYPSTEGIVCLPEKRIEELDLVWVGNVQFAPTLLGYIEGAPPVPSENLTVDDSYAGATSVELRTSEDVEFSWNRAKESSWGSASDLFVGYEAEIDTGITIPMVGQVASFKTAGTKAGFKGELGSHHGDNAESKVSAGSSNKMSDKLELCGWREDTPKFPDLGQRFIPKNVGYALVISALADLFITRLSRSRRMVGSQIVPLEDIPPDINTITFLINPAYTMNGSLDGLTGSSATSDRFFKHVPEMRSQFGSEYPASYLRLKEAYDLKHQIELQDKQREAYFYNFNAAVSKVLGNSAIDDQISDTTYDSKTVGLHREVDKPTKDDRSQEEKNAAKLDNIDNKMDDVQASTQVKVDKTTAEASKKREEIQSIRDGSKRREAARKFEAWQIRMEALKIRAGKRNLVNTYVWDADGGLRAETQDFASTIEHTLASDVGVETAFGGEGNFNVLGATVELTAQATYSITQTLSKTEERSTGMELNIDLEGVEKTGVTDFKDRPLMPGEKVDRYRFMSFYLEGSTRNFTDFFDYVVDPEWLASNDEEARALRQANGKANKTWRVLHRVTYVERPALMGFCPDLRKLPVSPEKSEHQDLRGQIEKLNERNQSLEDKLNQILDRLTVGTSELITGGERRGNKEGSDRPTISSEGKPASDGGRK
jgi:hypothetical protein